MNRWLTGRTAFSILITAAALAGAPSAEAQATRTWVSGVGDDVNPCSRTAPCKTFAGAISKTADGGEIDTLDPGGFGQVTISKGMTLDGQGTLGSILAAGVNGVNINAANKTVVLRNLTINGAGTGLIGINILAAKAVRIENCVIMGFRGGSARGITDTRTSGTLSIINTVVSNNAQTGILLLPATASTLTASLDRVYSQDNGNAGFAMTGGKAVVTNSSMSGNTNYGFYTEGSSTVLSIQGSEANFNGVGVSAQVSSTVRLGNSTVLGNTTGLNTMSSGTLYTYGNNRLDGNTSDGAGAALPLR